MQTNAAKAFESYFGNLDRREGTYAALATTFAVVLVLTNVIGTKLFVLLAPAEGEESVLAFLWAPQGMTLTSGIITYPLTFLITDLVSEIWGHRRARFMVVMGFVMSVVMLGFVSLARALPPSDAWRNPEMGVESAADMQHAWEVSFALPGKLLFASMLAYLVAQLFDVRLYHFWWRVTKGKYMWIRNTGSTSISQLVDTIIVNGIFLSWGLHLEWEQIWKIIAGVYFCKVVLAIADTPLIYLARHWIRQWFGLEQESAPQHAPLA